MKYKNIEIPISDCNFVDDVAIINIKETGEILCLPFDDANESELTIIQQIKDDVATRPEPTIAESIINEARIAELKLLLANSDYVVLKIAEGVATAEEYSEVIAQRQSWREEINSLMAN